MTAFKAKSVQAAALGAAVLLLGASQASAAMLKITLTGNTESVNDFQNVFGLGAEAVGDAANITDQPFVETFLLNTDGANAANGPTFVSNSPFFGVAPPYVLAASVTINGHTFSTLGANGSYLSTSGDYYGGSEDAIAGTRDTNDIDFDIHAYGSAPLPATVTDTFSATLDPADYEVIDSFGDATSGGEHFDAAGELYATRITAQAVSAAPEPSAWMLMLAGVAFAGLVLRRGGRRLLTA